MNKIIYKVIYINGDHSYDTKLLNEYGKEGWIFISSKYSESYSKRVKVNGISLSNTIGIDVYKHLFYKVITE